MPRRRTRARPKATTSLPKVARRRRASKAISAQTLATRIDSFLASRGYKAPERRAGTHCSRRSPLEPITPAEFICEDDVRAALRSGRKLLVGEQTIITPAARDLGESQKVFQQAAGPLDPLDCFARSG